MYYGPDSVLAHTILGSEHTLADLPGMILGSDLKDLLAGQLTRMDILTPVIWPKASYTPLAGSITYVHLLCPDKQVFRTHAGWNIAAMQYTHSVRDWTHRQLPTYPMGQPEPLPEENLPVSVAIARRLPQPAPITLLNLGPEPKPHVLSSSHNPHHSICVSAA